jgi:hypothetical protein
MEVTSPDKTAQGDPIDLCKQSRSLPIFPTGMGWRCFPQVIGQQQLSALAGIKADHHAVGSLPGRQLGQQSPPRRGRERQGVVSAYGGSDLNFWGSLDHHSLGLRAREPPPHADQWLSALQGAHPGQRPLRMLWCSLLLGQPRTKGPWRWSPSCPGTRVARTTSATCRPSACAAMPPSDGRRGQAHGMESASPSGCLGPPSTSEIQCLAVASERTAMRS